MVKPGEQERRRLLQGGETSTITLKAATPYPVEMAERSCSVANAREMIRIYVEDAQVRRILSRVTTKMPGKGYVEAEPKTQKSRRSIVIAPFALEALQHHRIGKLEAKVKVGPAWQEHDYVFCTSIGTHLNPTRDMLDQLKVLLKKAGLPDIRFHDLRHSAATLLLSVGVHPKVVQEILGHSQISITMDVYSHVLPGMQHDAMSRLNDVIKEDHVQSNSSP
jgi:integrase